MYNATMDATAAKWMTQWKQAELLLWEERARELASMDDLQARAASEALLSLADPSSVPAWRREGSGLVEQQRLFRNGRS